ncbi:hypothetical protein [Metabacillus fastidiosus]|uniref:hypothetical protein n=1 Tax=Metabacillus fastidiosus TaxID=1458 RepID=UPI00082507CE|nr:hypothetical protein [Metabacillus fastidiosus]
MMKINKTIQRTYLFFYHTLLTFLLLMLFNTIINLIFDHDLDANFKYDYKLSIIIVAILIIIEQVFYNKLVETIEKFERKIGPLLLIILLISLALFCLFFLVNLEFNILFNLSIALILILFLVIDFCLYGVYFSNSTITLFERVFNWIMIFIGGISLLSLFPGEYSKTITPYLEKYGYQATMLSLVFGFILFFINEFNNRREKASNSGQNITPQQIEELNAQLKLLNNSKIKDDTIFQLEKEIKALKKQLTRTEENLKEHMNVKTAQIIRKTQKNNK